jgi:intracellular multiplication protein IcmD
VIDKKFFYRLLTLAIFFLYFDQCFAQTRTLGEMFTNLGESFPNFGRLLVGFSYVAGIGFGIAAAYKFKQYKDNPTQIPIGTPVALIMVSTLLIFMPTLAKPAGNSLFGTTAESGWFINKNIRCLPGHSC